ncbi:MAG: hypothetical protein ACP5JG_01050 [Anaerolineae bacterium]
MSKHCTAYKKDGTPCRAWAVRGSDPPRCAAHGGGKAPVGAPKGNQNALKHGLYARIPPPEADLGDIPDTINAVIRDLAIKQARLSNYINGNLRDLDVRTLARLLQLHAQTASRLGRLLRDQRALSGEAADGISGAIAQALDELSNELGVDL